MRLQRIKGAPILIGVLFFGVLLINYIPKVARTVYGGGDSGELITASYVLGVPHAPGYPLYTLIGALFARLPIPGSIAFKVNLTSAIFEAATAAIVFAIIYLLTKRTLIALFGSLTLAFSYGFWFYAEFAETFPLNNFLASLIIFFLLLWYKTEKKFFLFSLFFLLGLSLTNHHIIVLLFPAVLIFLILNKKRGDFFFYRKQEHRYFDFRNIFIALILFLIPLSLYIYPVISAKFLNPPLNWDNPVNLENLIRLVSRADYGVFQSQALAVVEQPQGRIGQISIFFRFFLADFTILGLPLLILSFIFLFVKDKKIFTFFSLAFLLSGPIFLAYANFPVEGAFEYGVIERFTLMSFIIAITALSLGVFYISQLIGEFFYKRKILRPVVRTYLNIGIQIVFLILPFTLFLQNSQRTDLSKNYWGKIFIEDIFSSVPHNSLFLIRGDLVIFNSFYLQLVEGQRPDLKIVSLGLLPLDWYYYQNLPRRYPDLKVPKTDVNMRFVEFIKANSSKFPIFLFGSQPSLPDFTAVPHGLVWRLYPAEKEPTFDEVKFVNNQIWQGSREFEKREGYKDLITEFIQNLYSDKRFELGRYLYNKDDLSEAEVQFEKALLNTPKFHQARTFLAATQSKNNKCEDALSNYNFLVSVNPYDYYILSEISSLYQDCFKDPQKAAYFKEVSAEVRRKVQKEFPLEKF
jgi:tetratricopeptide (TPR) repeat protein